MSEPKILIRRPEALSPHDFTELVLDEVFNGWLVPVIDARQLSKNAHLEHEQRSEVPGMTMFDGEPLRPRALAASTGILYAAAIRVSLPCGGRSRRKAYFRLGAIKTLRPMCLLSMSDRGLEVSFPTRAPILPPLVIAPDQPRLPHWEKAIARARDELSERLDQLASRGIATAGADFLSPAQLARPR